MATHKPLSISLTSVFQAFVADLVKAGRYGIFGEVVREGLRLLQKRKQCTARSGAAASSPPEKP